ncbi:MULTISPECIES: gliding motility-associated protein GldE [Bacteroidota]|uniref:Gliding motility-associated protein GldE n=1 Tax=Flectobacillus roseus TaxID=502259 RepID=A0ABT6YAV1_9BACT|nr:MULTISPECIES: gliding motility-associated protein GldE [Bacteroidota]NBA74838.1 gliding motility-associated protein GldE [Emticicia sp. ODNR4P]MDI9860574.1 gliding motility-associated protein GldE [Flectobacillus roseus]MDI9869841.1 gliding motility-associated protein GldE [Flectobacillus roseus]NBB30135.1 gliding motility-associated protein GldE [Cellulophaga sp. BC115SP]PAC33702.1 magnesium/cobalt efflux protein [Flectobacillus sp. BAB-3569]
METRLSDDYHPIRVLLAQVESTSSYSVYGIDALILIALLGISALLAGSEVAFFSLSADERVACRESDSGSERTVAKLLDKPQQLLATLLIAINLVNITFVTISTYLTEQILGEEEKEGLVATLILLVGVTFMITFFGELIPKVWAQQNNLKFAKLTAPLIEVASIIFKPLSSLLLGISNIIEKRVERKGYTITADELNHALEITTGQGTSAQEKDILKGIVNFGSTSAKSAMRPRRDVTAFDIEWDFHELMDKINKSGYSRVPVFKETIDKIEGVLYIKDLLPHIEKDEHFNWQELIHQAFFIPESKKIDDLLYDFQEKRVHMAIVVNEYGETEGIITMEDIIEEIVGDINDEYDEEDLGYKRLEDGSFEFEGKVTLNDVCRALGIDNDYFEKVKGESESLAGLLIELFARLPHAGEEIDYDKFRFRIASVDTRRIKRVKVTIKNEETDETNRELT